MVQAGEPVFVQAFVPLPPIEAPDVGVPVRLAGLDQPQRHPIAMRPAQHRLAREFLAVVAADNRRYALTPERDSVDRIIVLVW